MNDNKFRVLIVDDEPDARTFLKSLLSGINYVEVVGEAENVENALFKIVEYYPNLVFMNINMSGKLGMEFIELLKDRNVDIPIVLVSAFEKYVINAIRNQVYDFLLKPILIDDLKAIVEKYKRLDRKDLSGKLMDVLSSIKEDRKIRINSRNSYTLISPSEIVYCEADDGCTVIHLTTGKMEVSNYSLTQIESRLEGRNFYRLGRSTLVNQNYVRSINKGTDSVLLKYNSTQWEVFSSHKSIRELLQSSYNYA